MVIDWSDAVLFRFVLLVYESSKEGLMEQLKKNLYAHLSFSCIVKEHLNSISAIQMLLSLCSPLTCQRVNENRYMSWRSSAIFNIVAMEKALCAMLLSGKTLMKQSLRVI